ncbi:MAG: ABC transporter permease [Clostridia bacterium]|jgi:ABC-type antimicrobial peptide transport system permease subunit|nr:ABC transporter permease [Clostridia bacterium]
MNRIDIVRIVFKNLLRRKMRTMLTVMGVVIGTASIVIMVSIGIGMNEGFKSEISRMGSLNSINVRSPETGMYYIYDEAEAGRANSAEMRDLDDAAVSDFARIDGVEAVIPFIETHGKIKLGKYFGYVQLHGINPEHMDKLGLKASEGRLLGAGDKMNVVFGFGVKNNLYNPKESQRRRFGRSTPDIDLLSDRITLSLDMSYGEEFMYGDSSVQIKPKTYKINGVGLLEEGSYEYYMSMFMDISELKKIVKDFNKGKSQNDNSGDYRDIKGYSRIIVKVKDIKDVQSIQKQIKDMGFFADSLTDILESMQKTTSSIRIVLGAIGAVSLLVASIGITNTMVMSIYERTREIGIMKVIGSSLGDIKRMFLFEASMIGLLGGIIGLLLSYGVSYGLNTAGFALIGFFGPPGGGSKPSIIPLWLAVSAMLFTTIIGLVSGFYPAHRAMNLSALEAIRKE